MQGYGTDAEFTAWVEGQGLSLPDDANVTALRAVGSQYLDAAYAMRLQCSRKTGGFEQDLEFPRTGHIVNGVTLPSDLIPKTWILASYRAAYLNATQAGWSTNANDPTRITKREKADVLEREYFAPSDTAKLGSASGLAADALIDAMVSTLLCPTGRDLSSLFMVI